MQPRTILAGRPPHHCPEGGAPACAPDLWQPIFFQMREVFDGAPIFWARRFSALPRTPGRNDAPKHYREALVSVSFSLDIVVSMFSKGSGAERESNLIRSCCLTVNTTSTSKLFDLARGLFLLMCARGLPPLLVVLLWSSPSCIHGCANSLPNPWLAVGVGWEEA